MSQSIYEMVPRRINEKGWGLLPTLKPQESCQSKVHPKLLF